MLILSSRYLLPGMFQDVIYIKGTHKGETSVDVCTCVILFSVINLLMSSVKPVNLECFSVDMQGKFRGPRLCSGNTLASHLRGWRFNPQTLCGKVGSCLPMVSSLK